MSLIETTVNGPVMTVTLADEERRNVLSAQLMTELGAAIDLAEVDPTIRVVVLTNRGSVFCAGADLTATNAGSTSPSDVLATLLARIQDSPLPFVGRLAGHCVAGGVGLAAVMDVSIAIDSATFGFSEVRVGVAPAVISVVCLKKLRLADAKSTFLRGHRFGATEAAHFGLINDAVATGELDQRVHEVVNDLLAGHPDAIAAAKRLTTRVPSMGDEEAFAYTARLSAELFATDAAREGMSAFLEKRPAAWVERLLD